MACRLPQAPDLRSLWRLLEHGVDAVSEVPRERWDVDAFYSREPGLPGRASTRWGGFVEGVDLFDPRPFRISPREASYVDPQQRLLLEVAWEALEDAGLGTDAVAGSLTGVFVGISTTDYGQLLVRDPAAITAYTGTGGSLSIAANRVSYCLDLRGPSLAVDTACSSSLVALDLACHSLRRGECSLALVGGVNLMLTPDKAIGYSHAHMMAADGRCKTFDARADGFVRGEGCVVVVIKPLAKALQDGDAVWGIVRASAVNQDGLTNGLSAPSGASQRAVIREALRQAGVAPEAVGYVEAHGTGTPLGDPIEMEALKAELIGSRPADRPCYVGSIKTNIGHLEAASGLAGLAKVLLAFEHGLIPRHLHLQQLNPRISLAGTPLEIATSPKPWPRVARPRLAGVSAFGFGGTNAHVIVEEPPPAADRPAAERPWHLLTLRAAGEEELRRLAGRYAAYLADHEDVSLAEVALTANTGRAELPHRLAAVASSPAELARDLAAFERGEGRTSAGRARRPAPKLAFLFTGQGAQRAGMGRELYETQPLFRASLERCDAILRPWLEHRLLEVLYPRPGLESPIDETVYAQPALFALEYSLAKLLDSWGIRPAVVLGHSIGEYAAACVAGVFALEEALPWVAERGRLMQALPRDGEMWAVAADEHEAAEALPPHARDVAVAAVNGPRSVVLSGRGEAVRAVVARLEASGRRGKRLNVSHAFHSPAMDAVLPQFERAAAAVRFSPPRLPVVGNLTGAVEDRVATPGYWVRHLREPVRFAAGIETLFRTGVDALVEIGPQPVLLAMGRDCAPPGAGSWLPALRAGRSDWQTLLEALGALFVLGAPVDFRAVDGPYATRRLRLPTYPFERKRYWLEAPRREPALAAAASALHPLLGQLVPSPLPERQYLGSTAALPSFLDDHRVAGQALLPAAAFVEMALAAASALGTQRPVVEQLTLHRPLPLLPRAPRLLQLVVAPEAEACRGFRVLSSGAPVDGSESWTLHASGTLRDGGAAAPPQARDRASVLARCKQPLSVADFYEGCRSRGLQYGPAFQRVVELRRGEREALGRIALEESHRSGADSFEAHPALLDACFQVLGAAAPDGASETYVPVRIERVQLHSRPGGSAWCHARLRASEDPGVFVGDLAVFDDAGAPLLDVAGLTLHKLRRTDSEARLHEIAWRPLERSAGQRQEPRRGAWLVLGAPQGLGPELVARLGERGESASLVTTAEGLETLFAEAPPLAGAVHLWGVSDVLDPYADRLPAEALQRVVGSALSVVRALGGRRDSPRLWLVTHGAQPVEAATPPSSIAAAGLWGLGRVASHEHAELRPALVDLDPFEDPRDASRLLVEELLNPDDEGEVAFRRGRRLVPRLAAIGTAAAARARLDVPAGPFRLRLSHYGDLETLHLTPAPRRTPGPGEIEIEVRAAGLNLRDVLNALGMLKPFAAALGIRSEADLAFGFECAGTVTAVGDGTSGLAPGDEVVALALGSMASHVTVDSRLAALKPTTLTFEEAAGLPVAYLTAAYGLRHLAKLRRGESVLVHAAAGGVGLAAVHLARAAGASVFATASRAKWELLRRAGVAAVMSSRSAAFADEVLERTGGQGVDVLLNSLSGDFIPAGLKALARGGRFVEIGKLGVWDAERVASARPDVAYFPFDLGDRAREAPELIASLLGEVLGPLGEGLLPPLTHRVVPIDDAPAAFRTMAQARHVGKLVLAAPRAGRAGRLRADATYLITGGAGGLGLRVAEWLKSRGARHLALVARRPPGAEAQRTLSSLETNGCQVRVLLADVTNGEALAGALSALRESMPPLAGVVHAAGVLDDGLLRSQSWDRFLAVLGPKVLGAWNLHALTRRLPLDFFVCFSSAAALFGTPGQGSYAAANAALDALAHQRRGLGLPAQTVNWGPWDSVGMTARMTAPERERLASSGVRALSPEEALEALADLLERDAPQSAVLKIAREGLAGSRALPPLLREWARPVTAQSAAAPPSGDKLLAQLRRAAPPDRPVILLSYLQRQTAKVLGLAEGQLPNAEASMAELGVESFMAFELKSALQSDLGVDFAADRLFDGTSLNGLAGLLVEQLKLDSVEPPD